ncbi:cyclic nucleotide-binding protein [Solemya pervernicosa gill symbiont]|uniref:Cyclic nucleotide-binding protein n=2 Tax=Gammaproteobacteria incertae sedis TaxID=118884 RepID=A0A1T2L2L4_9GAMM|nr:putative nucleotidyltransferase substrate binding domain-containing protein [Candidatus Reidiella endopervernicosa]OOZ39348.1 cyclic nucleotide-binding protein [Solemya pervernicosa gill symbiont]QKQ26517.1 cyclic nucleotide-binding/CBS domain-containing protein [Candidatus Reidiella endopervernicosa]
MDVELIEIREFVAAYPPFNGLPDDELARIPELITIRYLRRGTPFPPTDSESTALYMVRKGAVELHDGNGVLIDRYGEGDIHLSHCLDEEDGFDFRGVTLEDTLLYQIDCTEIRSLRQRYPWFNSQLDRSLRESLRDALQNLQQSPMQSGTPLSISVAELVQRKPITLPAETSIREAAQLMTSERISSLLILDKDKLCGIVTDRDLRARAIAEGLSTEWPIRKIMSTPVSSVSPNDDIGEVAITMTRLNVHHLPVCDGEELIGLISNSDLLRQQSINSIALIGQIEKCDSAEELAVVCKRLPELQSQLVAVGTNAYQIGQTLSALTDAVTRRLIIQSEARLGPPPHPYVWLSYGSQARHEQSIHSDQDNGLLYEESHKAEHDVYFEQLTQEVNDGLNLCGYKYCPGEVMANNAAWRQTLSGWQSYFDRWINAPERKALMHTSIFFDMRPIYGDEALFEALHKPMLKQCQQNGIFHAHMAANALDQRPPLGFFRNFVLIHDGEHNRTLDLKQRGTMPIVELARLYALAEGLSELNTRDRLRAAAGTPSLSKEGAADLEHALAFIATLRLHHQSRQIRAGEPVDNYLSPDDLSSLEREQLKDVFVVIRTMQATIEQRYQTERFY